MRPWDIIDYIQGGPERVSILIHHIYGTIQDKMTLFSPKCSENL